MTSSKKKGRWAKVRKFFNDLHLWAGLASGLIVIVVCFSGTVYVFNTESKEMASPELYRISPPPEATPLTGEQIITKVENSTAGKVVSVKIPSDPERTWQVSVKNESTVNASPGVQGGSPGMATVYAVNPYSGEIAGDISNNKNGTTEFMRTLFSLHRWLLLDRVENPLIGELPNKKLGSYITGTATILFTIGVLTGLVIWFPQKIKSLRQGLKIKWQAKWKRLNHDLHNALAFYSLIFLFLMGITGPQWSFPWYREGIQKTLGTYRPADAARPAQPKSKIPVNVTDLQKLTLAAYMSAVDQALPYAGDYAIQLPVDSSSVVSIAKNRTGFFAPSAADKVSLDQYTGAIIDAEIFREKPFNERVAGSIKALHLGDAYGTFTKILYFMACLVATSLPVTGTIIWLNKLQKKRRKALKAGMKYLKFET